MGLFNFVKEAGSKVGLGESPSEVWMAQVVSAGCMGSAHLWQDLGLWSRPDLTQLRFSHLKFPHLNIQAKFQ